MRVATIGIDLARNSFQLHGVDAHGKVALRKQVGRGRLLEFFANLPCCRVGIEACGGAHYWARELTKLGHEVRLMAPQYVTPYVETNKHDAADAEGCCEAVQRPSMRFVPVKTEIQQALLMLHRIRDRLIAERTGTINAVRGHMAEFGIVAARREPGMRELLARELLVLQVEHLRAIETRLAELDRRLLRQAREEEACKRLAEVPGIGCVIATAMVATVGDAKLFDRGRSFAAWLGLTPRQHATGGRERLLGISKRGDGCLRRQLMHGARSLVRLAARRDRQPWAWIDNLLGRRPFNVVVAAVANKLARIIWALLSRGETYRAPA
ncbi:MAG: IS110 family transposase [Geminicoccaceae bacterium]